MSQVNQPGITLAPRIGSGRAVWIAVVVAIVFGAGLVLALTLSGGPDSASPNGSGASAQVASRPDGGPSESSIAASVGTRATPGPQESQIVAWRDWPVRFFTGPDEPRVVTTQRPLR